jgi:hypothetical protein
MIYAPGGVKGAADELEHLKDDLDAYGYVQFDQRLLEPNIGELLAEADERHSAARKMSEAGYTFPEGTGLRGPRHLHTSAPGPRLDELHRSAAAIATTSCLFRARSFPTRAAFLYYEPGDYVGLHKDITYCAITLIIPLSGECDPLIVYPDYYQVNATERLRYLAQIVGDGADERESQELTMEPGSCLALLGASLPHRRPRASSTLTTMTLCYSPV